MKDSVQLIGGHFQLLLLWRSEDVKLPNNRVQAERRLNSLKRRLIKDKGPHQKCVETMQKYIDCGHAQVVNEEVEVVTDRTWFLPHFPVLNSNKPGKLRIVFDCAAEHQGTSLNKVIMQGPDLVNSLVGVLLRFRLDQVALVADIEAMFHQVKVKPGDRESLKFLWWPDGNMSRSPKVYQMTVHLFGCTSSPSCTAFCLRKAARRFGSDFSSGVSKVVCRNIYVDDCLVSADSTGKAVSLVSELRQLLLKSGFRLKKWASNCPEVLAKLPKEECSGGSRPLRVREDQGHCHWTNQLVNACWV